MLSKRRLFYLILIVIVISAIFIIYNINEENSKSIEITNKPLSQEEFISESVLPEENQLNVYVVGSNEREIYDDIYNNVIQYLENIHIPYYVTENVKPGELGLDNIIIFCEEAINTYVDLIELGEFISRGGRVIFAAGLSEGNEDSYLWPYLGITEKTVRENYNELEVVNSLWPIDVEEKSVYDGYSLSTWIAVRGDAAQYLVDADKKVPVLYTYDYGEGRSCLINGTYLADMGCSGLLSGAIGAVVDDFIYPVMGVKAVFLDNFPMVTYINDRVCMKMYGRSTEPFVRDVVWPLFQGISLRTNTMYSSSVLTVASSEKSFPEINNSLFTTIGKSALQFGGELIYAANCTEPDKVYYNHAFIEKLNDIFDHNKIKGLALISEELREELLQIPGAEIQSIRGGLNTENSIQYQDKYFIFPACSYGNTMEDGNLFRISSVLGSYGIVSHVFDINTLIAKDENTASWDTDKKQINIFESEILSQVSYLEGRTLSETKDIVKSYVELDYRWIKSSNKIYLTCSNMRKGQSMFYKTGSKIISAEGLTFEELDHGYYLLRINQNNAVIELEER